jgi:hypothetical protein
MEGQIQRWPNGRARAKPAAKPPAKPRAERRAKDELVDLWRVEGTYKAISVSKIAQFLSMDLAIAWARARGLSGRFQVTSIKGDLLAKLAISEQRLKAKVREPRVKTKRHLKVG